MTDKHFYIRVVKGGVLNKFRNISPRFLISAVPLHINFQVSPQTKVRVYIRCRDLQTTFSCVTMPCDTVSFCTRHSPPFPVPHTFSTTRMIHMNYSDMDVPLVGTRNAPVLAYLYDDTCANLYLPYRTYAYINTCRERPT